MSGLKRRGLETERHTPPRQSRTLLITCDETNTASRRVIEANKGRYINNIDDKRRYWVPTA